MQPPKLFKGLDEEKLAIIQMKTHEVKNSFEKTDANKHTGGGDTLLKLLKEYFAQLEEPIKVLLNTSLGQDRVSCAWKRARCNSVHSKVGHTLLFTTVGLEGI